jgi:hypothetical protein
VAVKVRDPAVVGEAVGDGAHGVLADAEADVAALAGLAVEVAQPLEAGLGRHRQIGVAAEEVGDLGGQRP